MDYKFIYLKNKLAFYDFLSIAVFCFTFYHPVWQTVLYQYSFNTVLLEATLAGILLTVFAIKHTSIFSL